ncbi:hydroxyisourate hydrolase [Herbidospora mongoliensis]|uniref:hydroxyisourate hydrolase n=1 Tax=Herbidospora mongoliensis TaxID=688067 RepID=UPI0008351593|nr:hydroxyisourate hydrolase [Herbidospora mongoliensis]
MGVLAMRITAQALDSMYGRAAAGVQARLEHSADLGWRTVASAETDGDGSILEWPDAVFRRGLYRLVFDSDTYFVGLGINAAYPEIAVMFRILDEADSYQIQVVLAPHSHSTYFGTAG